MTIDFAKMTKVALGKEMLKREIVGQASFFIRSSLKWDEEAKRWTGKFDYGKEGLGRFSKDQMVRILQAYEEGRSVRKLSEF